MKDEVKYSAYIEYLIRIVQHYNHIENNVRIYTWIEGKLQARL